ncbi:Hypothetical protein R9X50_00409100 [Acrodontium crateriforme]|uniref:Uncharacterized protein n=1 Tax=Acrodontium crateriforme TaxID=150365 RepID=A0AAQ3M6X8_9PEZI|nr:Hypothetical protein R9X50_00409100 [Acrodontium crateriforme]
MAPASRRHCESQLSHSILRHNQQAAFGDEHSRTKNNETTSSCDQTQLHLTMTRRIVYGISFWVFLGAAACTIASIAIPSWVTYTSPTSHDPIRIRYGLHQRCSSISGKCTPFPQSDECHGEDRYFCSMWRTTGFLMNFSVIMEVVCVVAYITILFGGRQSREAGWKIMSGLLGLVAAGQMIAMALVAYLYEHDNRFFVGSELGKSWVLSTVSWSVLSVDAIFLIGAALFLSSEDDYELIPDPQ